MNGKSNQRLITLELNDYDQKYDTEVIENLPDDLTFADLKAFFKPYLGDAV
jgi:hypothetical protein